VELLLTAIIPISLVIIKKSRRSPYGLATASFSASFGLVLNRMDVGIFGYFRDAGTVYFPSLIEWTLSIGVVAAAALVFLFVVENFSIFDDHWKEYKSTQGIFSAAFDSISGVWRTALRSNLYRLTLLGIFIIPTAFVFMYPPYSEKNSIAVSPAIGLNTTRSALLIDGNRTGMSTQFPHLKHQEVLGKEKSCIECHHMSFPNDKSTPCSRCHCKMFKKASIFDHEKHTVWVAQKRKITGLYPENKTCNICHSPDMPKNKQTAVGCLECHNEDMNVVNASVLPKQFIYADSYLEAMHKKCISCHQKKKKKLNKPMLDHCSNCHQTLYFSNNEYKYQYSQF
jgi:hypothetical protein